MCYSKSVSCVCVYLIKKVDGGLIKVAGEGDLMIADGVKQLVLIFTTEWRLHMCENRGSCMQSSTTISLPWFAYTHVS